MNTNKTRPWRHLEVPMPCLLRGKNINDSSIWVALSSGPNGIATSNAYERGETKVTSFGDLFLNTEHSIDGGKTWLPCGVVED